MSDLASDEARLLARFGHRFRAGEIVFAEGASGTDAYVLHQGRVRLSRHIRGVERSMSTVKPGDIFGEFAIFGDAPRSCTATTLTEAVVVVLTREALLPLLSEQPSVALRLISQLARRLRDTEDRIETTFIPDHDSRILRVLLALADTNRPHDGATERAETVAIPLSPIELAIRVGIDLGAVKVVMQRLRDKKYVRLTSDSIELLDITAMRKLYTYLGEKELLRA